MRETEWLCGELRKRVKSFSEYQGAVNMEVMGGENFVIHVREENKRLPVGLDHLRAITDLAFRLTGSEPGDVSLVVSDDPFISELNERYLETDGPTDVLSFPQREGIGRDAASPLVGDIVISLDTAKKQAGSPGSSLETEFVTLYVHGLLHLLGYTHDGRTDKRKMEEAARKILSRAETYI